MIAALVFFLAMQTPDFDSVARQAAEVRDASRTDEAIELYRRALELRPGWKEGLWFLGSLEYDRERFPEARDVMRRFVASEPDAGPGFVLLGMSEFQTREYARALTHLQRGLAQGLGGREEMTRSAWYLTAVLLTRFERFDESMEVLLSPRFREQRDARVMEALGAAALRMPLLPAEIPAARREMFSIAGEAASAFAARDDVKAATLLRQLVEQYPDEPGIHLLYGDLLMKSRPEEGIEQMRRELEVAPDNIHARIQIASEYVREDKSENALPFARQAVALAPGASDAHLVLGQALVGSGDLAAGIRELEAARDAAPKDSRVRWALARAYFAAGRKADGDREAAEMERLKSAERKSEGSR